ncbi:YcfL family protein [Haemophilus parahaemolyticus]|uniref:YcfL family protein n=1 Tax=Haemophilus parahaemolyticus TaxID=735 RepID=UPI00248F8B6D|nr:YcfL family protein [Haemophilus parahaemolyticus]
MRKFLSLAIFSLFLTACGSNPQSYITPKSSPIVNIDASLNATLDVKAKSDHLTVKNLSEQAVNFAYKLFWYDGKGVTQLAEHSPQTWQPVTLRAKETMKVELEKPTEESENYRVYLKP